MAASWSDAQTQRTVRTVYLVGIDEPKAFGIVD